jgi:cold shock CspA family protein
MGRSSETFNKKEVRNKKEKKRKEKEKKRLERKDQVKSNSLDDMIAYVDEHGHITSTPPDPDQREEINAEEIQVSVQKREKIEEDVVRQGTVIFFNDSKGFGFIRDEVSKNEVFVHVNNTLDDIKENSKVTFEIEQGQKGPSAVRVKLI